MALKHTPIDSETLLTYLRSQVKGQTRGRQSTDFGPCDDRGLRKPEGRVARRAEGREPGSGRAGSRQSVLRRSDDTSLRRFNVMDCAERERACSRRPHGAHPGDGRCFHLRAAVSQGGPRLCDRYNFERFEGGTATGAWGG
jgi:hypothetical protein